MSNEALNKSKVIEIVISSCFVFVIVQISIVKSESKFVYILSTNILVNLWNTIEAVSDLN